MSSAISTCPRTSAHVASGVGSVCAGHAQLRASNIAWRQSVRGSSNGKIGSSGPAEFASASRVLFLLMHDPRDLSVDWIALRGHHVTKESPHDSRKCEVREESVLGPVSSRVSFRGKFRPNRRDCVHSYDLHYLSLLVKNKGRDLLPLNKCLWTGPVRRKRDVNQVIAGVNSVCRHKLSERSSLLVRTQWNDTSFDSDSVWNFRQPLVIDRSSCLWMVVHWSCSDYEMSILDSDLLEQ